VRADAFTTIRSAGGLLPSDALARVAEGHGLPGLEPRDYHLVEGETVRVAANRAWTRLAAAWASFKTAFAAAPPGDATTGLTRERWLQVLFSELGYGRLPTAPAGGIAVNGSAYLVSHQWGSVPIHLVGARVPLDKRTPGVAGAARRPPYSTVQELLNRSDDHLWGFVSNGLRLLLLRDSSSLVRQAFVEFDLEAIFEGEVFSDFVVLYLVSHQSRVEVRSEETGPASCWLERWRAEAIASGTRALDSLRDGVTEALRTLGQGFLAHPANAELRARLADGRLSGQDYYRALLRLVYRLLFCFVAEDRQVLLAPDADPATVRRYDAYFSTARLRRLAAQPHGSRHGDLWIALRFVFDALGDDGCPQLGLPALGGALFAPESLGPVGHSELANADLLAAVRSLSQIADRASGTTRAVDYRNLGAEELGSVYESLLELAPQHDPATGQFTLAVLAGNERKTTGSYYTPSSLIDCLLDTALDPLLDEAEKAEDPQAALLALTVCDPACGSGHFLVAAARRIARRLAAVRTEDAEPPEERVREALREVVGRCIYGVDVNELAAELAKVSLWLEAVEPGKPLPFLDGHIKVGNSLLGTTPALLARGIPDDAFKPLTGDDKPTVSALRRRNKGEREQAGQGELFDPAAIHVDTGALTRWAEKVAAEDDTTIAALHRRVAAWRALEESAELAHARLVADAWCAAFVWPKSPDAPPAVTHRVLMRLDENPEAVREATRREVERLAAGYQFFHWHLEFPEVFRTPNDPASAEHPELGWSGGFSCVIGNPPWEQIQLDAREFFAVSHPEIARKPNVAARERAIAGLAEDAPTLFKKYNSAKRFLEETQHLVHSSGRFPLTSFGRLNTAPLFAECVRYLIELKGIAGLILPTGIATDSFNQGYFRDLVETSALASLYDFENRLPLFESVDSRFKFCLLTLTGPRWRQAATDFAFFLHDPAELARPDVRFSLKPDEITLLNPNTGTCPIFRSRRDAEITLDIYRRVPILIRRRGREENPWGLSFQLMFMMNTDSHRFKSKSQLKEDGWRLEGNIFVRRDERYLPLYEAKMIHHYDHRWATYEGDEMRDLIVAKKRDPGVVVLPRYWVAEREVEQRLTGRSDRGWLLGFRDICRSTDERTAIASLLPRAGIGNNVPLLLIHNHDLAAGLQACWSSYALDFVARQKVASTHMNFFIAEQLPVLPPASYRKATLWLSSEKLADWITKRLLELAYTAWDMAPYARDLGYDGPPFVWEEERRAFLRAELDAAYFHLYGIEREDVDYILETFPIVRRKDEARFGEFRTKRLILEIYDRMADAISGGPLFDTVLDPPPGHGPTYPDRDLSNGGARQS